MSSSSDSESNKPLRERELEELSKFFLRENALPDVSVSGVLLSDQIKKCVIDFDLIKPFDERAQLKAASYRLTVGERYALGGEISSLSRDGQIKIDPFQVVVIQTRERINMPRNMIARWNIKVSQAYRGLVWVGGPQVDPGYVGYLFCPIYNLSDRQVTLSFGEEVAVIDFVKTSAFSKGCKEFERPPKRKEILLEDYCGSGWKSALYTEVWQKIQTFEKSLNFLVGITFAVIGVLVAALSIRPTKAGSTAVLTFLFFAAFALSVLNFLGGANITKVERKARIKSLAPILVAFLFGVLCTWIVIRWL
jgi:deoxycytidine triphosphate deaminase